MTRAASTIRGLSRQEAAAHWFVRRDAGDMSVAERAQFDAWVTDAANRVAFERAQRSWAVFEDANGDPHLQALRRAALSARREPRWRAIAAGVVAVAASLVIVSIYLGQQRGVDPGIAQASVSGAADAPAAGVATAPGERREVQLPDGSVVMLNTDTALDIIYSPTERLIVLRKGQAFFEVARHPDRPFVVQTPYRRVIALGTSFDVALTAGLFQVVLVEGSVKVDPGSAHDADAQTASREVVLTPGQALVSRLGVEERVIELDVERELRWRSGFVEFDNEPLGEAVAEMNRYYSAPVVVSDPRVAQLRLSGIFRTTPRQEFLSIVSEVLPVRVAVRSGEAVELAWDDRVP